MRYFCEHFLLQRFRVLGLAENTSFESLSQDVENLILTLNLSG
jgi:hypothetical protein